MLWAHPSSHPSIHPPTINKTTKYIFALGREKLAGNLPFGYTTHLPGPQLQRVQVHPPQVETATQPPITPSPSLPTYYEPRPDCPESCTSRARRPTYPALQSTYRLTCSANFLHPYHPRRLTVDPPYSVLHWGRSPICRRPKSAYSTLSVFDRH